MTDVSRSADPNDLKFGNNPDKIRQQILNGQHFLFDDFTRVNIVF